MKFHGRVTLFLLFLCSRTELTRAQISETTTEYPTSLGAFCTDSDYSPWSQWSACSVTCGKGSRSRSRDCNGAISEGTETCTLSSCANETEPRQEFECSTGIDVSFLIDTSGSVGIENFKRVQQFTKDVTKELKSGYERLNLTVITFNSEAKITLSMNESSKLEDLLKAEGKLNYTHGGTETHKALQLLHKSVIRNNTSSPQVAIVITDGSSWHPDLTKHWAEQLKKLGIVIYVVGVGDDFNPYELSAISSDPDEKYFFRLNNYEELSTLIGVFSHNQCPVTTTVQPSTTTTKTTSTTTTSPEKPTTATTLPTTTITPLPNETPSQTTGGTKAPLPVSALTPTGRPALVSTKIPTPKPSLATLGRSETLAPPTPLSTESSTKTAPLTSEVMTSFRISTTPSPSHFVSSAPSTILTQPSPTKQSTTINALKSTAKTTQQETTTTMKVSVNTTTKLSKATTTSQLPELSTTTKAQATPTTTIKLSESTTTTAATTTTTAAKTAAATTTKLPKTTSTEAETSSTTKLPITSRVTETTTAEKRSETTAAETTTKEVQSTTTTNIPETTTAKLETTTSIKQPVTMIMTKQRETTTTVLPERTSPRQQTTTGTTILNIPQTTTTTRSQTAITRTTLPETTTATNTPITTTILSKRTSARQQTNIGTTTLNIPQTTTATRSQETTTRTTLPETSTTSNLPETTTHKIEEYTTEASTKSTIPDKTTQTKLDETTTTTPASLIMKHAETSTVLPSTVLYTTPLTTSSLKPTLKLGTTTTTAAQQEITTTTTTLPTSKESSTSQRISSSPSVPPSPAILTAKHATTSISTTPSSTKVDVSYPETTVTSPPTTVTEAPQETTSTEPPTTTTPSCIAKFADVVFVVDSSGSIGRPNFEKIKEFIKDVVLTFDVDPRYTRVGLIEFSTTPSIEFKLNEKTNLTDLIDAIDNITYSGGGTSTSDALELMRIEGFDRERPLAPDVAIIITDGLSKFPPLTRVQAQLARAEGIAIFSIGIGNQTSPAELQAIASSPRYVFEVGDYQTLFTLDSVVAHRACGVVLPEEYHTRSSTPSTTTRKGCFDTDAQCPSYPRDSCTDYEPWARKNCPRKCGFCPGFPLVEPPCEDTIADCSTYGTDMCSSTSQYEWVDSHCRKFCGFCGNKTDSIITTTTIPVTTVSTVATCSDLLPNCSKYGGPSMCQTYGDWAKVRCAKYCEFCYNYTTVPSITVNNIKCPNWKLPDVCTLDASDGNCCPMPKCPDNIILTVKRH